MGKITPEELQAMSNEFIQVIKDSKQNAPPYLVKELTRIAQKYSPQSDLPPRPRKRRRRKVVPPPAAKELVFYLNTSDPSAVFDLQYGVPDDLLKRAGEWQLRIRQCELPGCGKWFLDTSPTWDTNPARFCSPQHRARFAKRSR